MRGVDRILAHERQGDGPLAVALLHGVGGSRRIWSDEVSGTARALAQAGFTALALDLPGYGDSPLPEGLSMASMAQAVADTLQALGFEPVGLDALQARCGWPTDRLQARLLEWELEGVLGRLPGGLFQRLA